MLIAFRDILFFPGIHKVSMTNLPRGGVRYLQAALMKPLQAGIEGCAERRGSVVDDGEHGIVVCLGARREVLSCKTNLLCVYSVDTEGLAFQRATELTIGSARTLHLMVHLPRTQIAHT